MNAELVPQSEAAPERIHQEESPEPLPLNGLIHSEPPQEDYGDRMSRQLLRESSRRLRNEIALAARV